MSSFGLDKMSVYFCIINAEQSNPGYFYKTGLFDDDIGVNCMVMIMTKSRPEAIASNYYCVTGSAARKKYAVLFCRKSQFWSRLFGMSRTESGRSGKYNFL